VTTLLLVRHGNTSTTGTLPPGRFRAAPRRDWRQAERAGERIAGAEAVDAIYTSPPNGTQTAAPIAKATGSAQGRTRPARVRLRRLDRAELVKLMNARAARSAPSTFRFPERRKLHRDAGGSSQHSIAPRQAPRRTIVRGRHADPIKAAMAHALGTHRPLPADHHLHLLDQRDGFAGDGPMALTVNSTAASATSCPARGVVT
jgi:probable phosphoglycerate mutase